MTVFANGLLLLAFRFVLLQTPLRADGAGNTFRVNLTVKSFRMVLLLGLSKNRVSWDRLTRTSLKSGGHACESGVEGRDCSMSVAAGEAVVAAEGPKGTGYCCPAGND